MQGKEQHSTLQLYCNFTPQWYSFPLLCCLPIFLSVYILSLPVLFFFSYKKKQKEIFPSSHHDRRHINSVSMNEFITLPNTSTYCDQQWSIINLSGCIMIGTWGMCWKIDITLLFFRETNDQTVLYGGKIIALTSLKNSDRSVCETFGWSHLQKTCKWHPSLIPASIYSIVEHSVFKSAKGFRYNAVLITFRLLRCEAEQAICIVQILVSRCFIGIRTQWNFWILLKANDILSICTHIKCSQSWTLSNFLQYVLFERVHY